ncbi:hypothetical protein [Acetobacter persici]|uniref:hypothetical protein n=1 Tax=Acetobacter persici TaxID=1076596 RepID=UPI00117815C6|nr:hypothetical protein [Acetobacter persici]
MTIEIYERLPSTEDRLINGVKLSDAPECLGFLDFRCASFFMSMCASLGRCLDCYGNALPDQAYSEFGNEEYFLNKVSINPKFLIEYYENRNYYYKKIILMLKSGRIKAYGKRHIEESIWHEIPCSYFSFDCKILFHKNKIISEGIVFFDVRIICIDGLPIGCAMIAYGDQEFIEPLVAGPAYFYGTDFSIPRCTIPIDLIREFLKLFRPIMAGGMLRACYSDTDEEVLPVVWEHCKISLQNSAISTASKQWKKVSIYTPHPPVKRDGKEVSSVYMSKRKTIEIEDKHKKYISRGYGSNDAHLAQKMHELISTGQAQNVHRAAWMLVDKAEGNSLDKSKVQRLMGVYNKTYPYSG